MSTESLMIKINNQFMMIKDQVSINHQIIINQKMAIKIKFKRPIIIRPNSMKTNNKMKGMRNKSVKSLKLTIQSKSIATKANPLYHTPIQVLTA